MQYIVRWKMLQISTFSPNLFTLLDYFSSTIILIIITLLNDSIKLLIDFI